MCVYISPKSMIHTILLMDYCVKILDILTIILLLHIGAQGDVCKGNKSNAVLGILSVLWPAITVTL